jgi:hypothetical protein
MSGKRLGKAPYRVLYSNDTANTVCTISPFRGEGQGFRPEMLQATVDEVAGTSVDVHILQPGDGDPPLWRSRVCPLEEHCRWLEETYGAKPGGYLKYVIEGEDLVGLFIERCRRHGQAPFVSLRLNDAHNKETVYTARGHAPGGVTRFYREHPEYRIGPDVRSWRQHVLNWAIPEVRERKIGFVRELGEQYDVDGFELDFMRHSPYFRLSETSADQRRAIMTGFCREVREILDETGGGKHRWLCCRIPSRLSAHEAMGIDVAAMADAGVEMFNLCSQYFTNQETDLAAIRCLIPEGALYLELCHSAGKMFRIAAYPGEAPALEAAYRADSTVINRMVTPEQYHTTAHLAYGQGADGISFFNFAWSRSRKTYMGRPFMSEPPFEVLRDIGDRAAVARKPQHYFLSGWGYVAAPDEPRQLPVWLCKGDAVTLCVELRPPEGGWTGGGRLRLQSRDPLVEAAFEVTLNGVLLAPTPEIAEPYPHRLAEGHLLGNAQTLRAWTVPAAALRNGHNEVAVKMTSGHPAQLVFVDVAIR